MQISEALATEIHTETANGQAIAMPYTGKAHHATHVIFRRSNAGYVAYWRGQSGLTLNWHPTPQGALDELELRAVGLDSRVPWPMPLTVALAMFALGTLLWYLWGPK